MGVLVCLLGKAWYDYATVSEKRTLCAFLIAPIATPLCFVLAALAFNPVSAVKDIRSFALVSLFSSLYMLVYAYGAELIFGLPLWWAFRRYRISSRVAFASTGGLIGGIVPILMAVGSEASLPWFQGEPTCAIAGLLSALVFREIVFSN